MPKRAASEWIISQSSVVAYKPGIDWAEKGISCGECGRGLKEGEQHWLLDITGKKRRRNCLQVAVCQKCFPKLNDKILDKSESPEPDLISRKRHKETL